MDNMIIQENDDEDRISRLPEEFIRNILSRLPTRDAVRTSVLSRAWEYNWRCISRVQINDRQSFNPRDVNTVAEFLNFVQRVVHQTQRDVTSFHLENWEGCYDPVQFTALIGAILMHRVKSLVLRLRLNDAVVLPRNLIQNTTLENLKLSFDCILKVPATASFPKLKRLDLSWVVFENNSSNDTMALHLPLVETIELLGCTVRNVEMMEIHAPALTTFNSTDPARGNEYSIKIISEEILVFKLDGAKITEEILLDGQQVDQAKLIYCTDYDQDEYDAIGVHAQNLLTRSLSNVRELIISGELLQIISCSTQGVTLPVFRHLVKLYVSHNEEDDHLAKGLLMLLRKTPCLKFLSIDCCGKDYNYTPAAYVPICLKDLEEIEFKLDFKWRKRGPLHLLNFLMENGRALKRIYVCHRKGSPVEEIAQYLLAFQRSSTELLGVEVREMDE